MLIVNIMLYMNHVIHHIETPPGLTPPRLLAGGWEGKVLWVDSLNMMYHVVHIQSAHFGFPRRTLLRGGVPNILFWDRAKNSTMSANSADGGNLFTALNHLIHNSTPRLLTVQRGEDYFYID